MKNLRHIILCAVTMLVSTAAMGHPTDRDLMLDADNPEHIFLLKMEIKSNDPTKFTVEQPFSIKSLGRTGKNLKQDSVKITLPSGETYSYKWKDGSQFPDSVKVTVKKNQQLSVVWGARKITICVRKEESKSIEADLLVLNESKIVLKGDTVNKGKDGTFVLDNPFSIASIGQQSKNIEGNLNIIAPDGSTICYTKNRSVFSLDNPIEVKRGGKITITCGGTEIKITVKEVDKAEDFPLWTIIIIITVLLVAVIYGCGVVVAKKKKSPKSWSENEETDANGVRIEDNITGGGQSVGQKTTALDEDEKEEGWQDALERLAADHNMNINADATPQEALGQFVTLLLENERKKKGETDENETENRWMEKLDALVATLGAKAEKGSSIEEKIDAIDAKLEEIKAAGLSDKNSASANTKVSFDVIRSVVKNNITDIENALGERDTTVENILKVHACKFGSSKEFSQTISDDQLEYLIEHPKKEQLSILKKYVLIWLKIKYNNGEIKDNLTADRVRDEKILIEGCEEDDKKIDAIVLKKIERQAKIDNIGSIDNLVAMLSAKDNQGDVVVEKTLLQRIKDEMGIELASEEELRERLNVSIVKPDNTDENVVSELKDSMEETEKELKSPSTKDFVGKIREINTVKDLPKIIFNCIADIDKVIEEEKTARKSAEEGLAQTNEQHNTVLQQITEHAKKQISSLNATADVDKVESPGSGIDTLKSTAENIINDKTAKIESLTEKLNNKNREIVEAKVQTATRDEKLRTILKHIANTFQQIEKVVEDSYQANGADGELKKGIGEKVVNNDRYGLKKFVEEVERAIYDDKADYDTIVNKLRGMFADALKGNSWIKYLAKFSLYTEESKVAMQWAEKRIDVTAIAKAFALTEELAAMVGVELQYPRLFNEEYDKSKYDEDTISDVQKYVADISNIIGTRSGSVIKDISQLGYVIDGEAHKAKVIKYN